MLKTLLDNPDPAVAQGPVKEIYALFPPGVEPPAPYQLLSVSPELMGLVANTMNYYRSHPRLSPELLASARFMVASLCGNTWCAASNRRFLEGMGLSGGELAVLAGKGAEEGADERADEGAGDVPGDLSGTRLEPGEAALLTLVRKVVMDPGSVGAEDVAACREAGWTDADMVDICFNAAHMPMLGDLLKAFVC